MAISVSALPTTNLELRTLVTLFAIALGCMVSCAENDSETESDVRSLGDKTGPSIAIHGIAGAESTQSKRELKIGGSSDQVSGVLIVESPEYGRDEVVGLLQVDSGVAFIQDGHTKIQLVKAGPMMAVASEQLMKDAARAFRPWADHRVRARGELQGHILWSVEVDPP